MINVFEIKSNIVKVILGLNLVFLIIYIFASSKAFGITIIVINMILSGTLLMMDRFGGIFDSRSGPLGNILGVVGNQLDSLMKTEDNNGKVQGQV